MAPTGQEMSATTRHEQGIYHAASSHQYTWPHGKMPSHWCTSITRYNQGVHTAGCPTECRRNSFASGIACEPDVCQGRSRPASGLGAGADVGPGYSRRPCPVRRISPWQEAPRREPMTPLTPQRGSSLLPRARPPDRGRSFCHLSESPVSHHRHGVGGKQRPDLDEMVSKLLPTEQRISQRRPRPTTPSGQGRVIKDTSHATRYGNATTATRRAT